MDTSSHNTKNHIEINGKLYDARSGSYLGATQPTELKEAAVHSVHGRSVDGFTRVSRSGSSQNLTILSAAKKVPGPARLNPTPHVVANLAKQPDVLTAMQHQPHKPGMTVAPHAPQKATTLMRAAVVKPIIKSPAHIKAHSRTDLLAKVPFHTVAPKISYNSINRKRTLHAERMIKSPAVSRYHTASGFSQLTPVNQPVAVAAPSLSQQVSQIVQQPPSHVPRPPRPVSHANYTAGHRSMNGIQSAHAAGHPTPLIAAPSRNIFEQALAEVASSEQKYLQPVSRAKRRSRSLRIVSISLLALFVIGFLTYQNTSSLSLKVASYRAGVHASLPSQQPAGFSYGSLAYQPGDVTIGFNSPKDGRQYNITQKSSNWDSQALLNNVVASANTAYKTYQRAGRTVYLLSNDTATWVDSGIWYTINGNSSLSPNQLLDVASNM